MYSIQSVIKLQNVLPANGWVDCRYQPAWIPVESDLDALRSSHMWLVLHNSNFHIAVLGGEVCCLFTEDGGVEAALMQD
ncbi:hypothetical protein M514_05208 [Trichuris suis]|uniref:Uncharacterized protein n=1 Tax=Trichuris suis TaxID=68888 RepID=A0A085MU73_9BILA|nr:hypothetical protein M513_05208 [Trichuris suis]KFD60769.1 hypothetical protein M514_05208 [Trichuris suis]